MLVKKDELENVALWKQRIQLSFKNSEKNREKYNRNLKFYKGEHYNNNTIGDRAKINFIFRIIQLMMPSLYYKNPYIIVKSKKPDMPSKAMVVETAINSLWKDLKFKKEIRKNIFDALISYRGYFMLGYETLTEQELLDNGTMNEKIKSESPYGIRIKPKYIFTSGEDELTDDKWYAHKYFKTKDELKADSNLKIPKNIKPTAKLSVQDKVAIVDDTDLDRFICYDIHDRQDGKLYTIVEGYDKFLRNTYEPYNYLGEFNLTELRFNEYGISDTENWIPIQQELNKIRTYMLRHIKRFNRKYIYNKDKISETEMEKIIAGEDGALAGISAGEQNVTNFIAPLIDAAISPDVYNVGSIVKSELYELSGMRELIAGGMGQETQLATVAMIQEAGKKLVTDDKLDLVGEFCVVNAEKLFKIIKYNYKNDKIFRMLDKESRDIFVKLTREGLNGEYSFDMQLGSTSPYSKEMRKNDLILVYDKFKEDIPNKPALIREILAQLELPNVDRILEAPAPTMQDTLKMLMAMKQNQPPAGSPAGVPPPTVPPVVMPNAGGLQLPPSSITGNEMVSATETNPMIEAIKEKLGASMGGDVSKSPGIPPFV